MILKFILNCLSQMIRVEIWLLVLIDFIMVGKRNSEDQLLTIPILANRFLVTVSRVGQIYSFRHPPIHRV